MTPFVLRQRLRFADCDPAGIAYYPRLFALADAVVEEWTEAVIGVSRRTLHHDRDEGLPTVALDADFSAVSRLGDWLDFSLTVTELGERSIKLAIEASCAGERRFGIRYTQVLVAMAGPSARPWPADWRRRIEEWRA